MRRSPRFLAALAAGALGLPALATAATPPGTGGAPMSILYDTARAVSALTHPDRGEPLSVSRGAFRQDPGRGGLLLGDGRDPQRRIGKVSSRELASLSAEEMAQRLRREIDHARFGARSHLVAVDEIGNRFNDGRVSVRYETRVVRGTRIQVAAHNELVVTDEGYRIERGEVPLPEVDADSPGARLSEAMRMLAATPSPYGGSYADRVHLYIAPSFVASIGMGRGPHHHLGRDGKPHRATWRGVMPALAHAGGVWLEVYHHSRARGAYPFTAEEWRRVPRAFARYHRRFGGERDRLHLVFSEAERRPAGAGAACGEPMACQWALARGTTHGRALLANGVGAYRLGSQARDFLVQLNRFDGGGRLRVRTNERLRPGERVRLRVPAGSRPILALVGRDGDRRVFEKLRAPEAGTVSVRLPSRVRPGHYRLMVYVNGEDHDRVSRRVRIVRPG